MFTTKTKLTMGTSLLMGALCAIMLQLTPTGRSELELVHTGGPVIVVDLAGGSKSMPIKGVVAPSEMIQVNPPQFGVGVVVVAKAKGEIRDGYVLHEPAPT